ncbi:hypothetical protein P4233_16205 [Pseudomonas aeruginosa]|nr:hypothetical protein [Pseudomonas aeruginosa]
MAAGRNVPTSSGSRTPGSASSSPTRKNSSSDVRSRRPLRAARVIVQDVAGDPGWYQISLAVRPHFKYMGANFELSLVGRLDKD